jgi:4-carboxymuconolactone decarboxylase
MAKKTLSKHEKTLVGLSRGEPELIDSLLQIQLDNIESSGLDPKTHALTRIAALIAIDAAPVSFVWQIGIALESGVTPEDIIGVMIALAPTVGMARIVAAAPEIAFALGLDIGALED